MFTLVYSSCQGRSGPRGGKNICSSILLKTEGGDYHINYKLFMLGVGKRR